MSGHSKWSTIKRKKGAADAKRGQIFTKLIKEITVAAREGGGDPEMNPRLRTAVDNAKAQNMTYEGYGPGGVAFFIECLTDNENRTVAVIRHILSKHGGNLGKDGSVAWMFDPKGQILIDASRHEPESVMLAAIDAGAEDVLEEEGFVRVMTPFTAFQAVQDALQESGIEAEEAELAMIPRSTVSVEGSTAGQVLRLVEALEEEDDVQKVAANFDIDEKILAEVG